MRRCDHLDGQVHAEHLLYLAGHHRAVEVEDVGVVFLCLVHHLVDVGCCVEERLGSVVLAEGIIGEQDVVAGHVGEHRVGPVEHRRLDEGQRVLADVERVTRLDVDIVPVLVIVTAQDGLTFLRAVDGRARNLAKQFRQCAAMVYLVVVHHDVVDVLQVDDLFEPLDKFAVVRAPHRVDEHILFVLNQIGIVAGAMKSGQLVTMEMDQVPVHLANPCDVVGNLLSHIFSYSSFILS